ncbi:MAG TPA: hypothetical protein VHY35_04235 [Stellaceae bacterium]|jgi:hypothetical protein|nr:hypothetical protein [Stellaceae bacterium]
MAVSAAEAFHAWHDFYLLIGAASATLVGAMFVVASIGSNMLTPRHEPAIRAFLTPTVIHLSTIMIAGALAMIPSLDWPVLGIAFGGGGVGGLVYSFLVGWRVVRRNHVARVDHVWYAVLPIVSYAVIVGAALTILLHATPNLEALAGGILLLLIAGIRNAWDMIIFFASRDSTDGSSS